MPLIKQTVAESKRPKEPADDPIVKCRAITPFSHLGGSAVVGHDVFLAGVLGFYMANSPELVFAVCCRPSTRIPFDLNAQLTHSLARLRQPGLGIGPCPKARNAQATFESRQSTAS